MSIRDLILESIEDAVFLEPDEFDVAILGVVTRCGLPTVVIYDRARTIQVIMAGSTMTEEEAEGYFEFNTSGAYVGALAPAFLDRMIIDEGSVVND
jgi:hypothetical protein